MASPRPTLVTLTSGYAVVAGAAFGVFGLAFALMQAALLRGDDGRADPWAAVLLVLPGALFGTLLLVSGIAGLQGKAWARAGMIVGFGAGILLVGVLFFFPVVVLFAVLDLAAFAVLFTPEAKTWFAASAPPGAS